MSDSAGKVVLDIVGNKKPFEGALNSLSGIASKAGRKIAGLFAVTSLAAFSRECVSAASSATQTANRVAAVFPKMQAQVDAFASTAMEKLGMTAGQAKSTTAQFGMMAQGMGFSERASAEMGSTLTKLAGDMAAFYGTTVEDAQSKLSGVFTGMTRGLKSIGVNMSEANLQAHALSLGISKSVSDMTEAELAALRLSYAQQQLARTSGYAQRNLGTWAGQTQLLQQQLAKLKATLGQALVAALLPAVKVLNAVMAGIIRVAQALNALIEAVTGKKLLEMVGGAAGTAVDLSDASEDAAGSTADLTDASEDAARAAKKQDRAQRALNRTLAGFDRINKLQAKEKKDAAAASSPSAGGIGSGIGGQIAAASGFADALADVDGLAAALKKIELPPALVAAFKKLGDAATRFVDAVKGGLSAAWEGVVKPFATWFVEKALPPIVRALGGLLDCLTGIGKAAGRVFGNIWDRYLSKVASWLGDAIASSLEKVAIWLEACGKWWADHEGEIDKAIDGFFDGLDAIAGIIKDFIIKNARKAYVELKRNFKFFGDKLAKIVKTVRDGLGKAIEGARKGVEAFRKVWEAVNDRAATLTAEAKEKVDGALAWLSGAWESVKDKAVTLLAAAKEATSGALSSIAALWDSVKDRTATLTAKAKSVVDDAWGTAKSAFETASSWLKDRAATLSATLVAVAGELWDRVAKFFDEWAPKWLKDATGTLKGILTGVISDTWQKVMDAFEWAKGGLRDIEATITGNANGSVSKDWNPLKSAFDWAKSGLKDAAATITGNVNASVAGSWGTAKGAFDFAGGGKFKSSSATVTANVKAPKSKALSKLKKTVSWAKKNIRDRTGTYSLRFNTTIDNMKRTINNSVINPLNTAIRTILPKFKGIPRLAGGGWVGRNTPQLAVIGDNTREGEIVSPESKFQEMLDKARAQGGDLSQLLEALNAILAAIRAQDCGVYLDGREITRRVVREVNRQTQATGRCPIVV